MLHKSLALALATAAASVSSPAVAAGVSSPAHGPAANHLVITVTESDGADGTYALYCDPALGRPHPEPLEACDALRRAEEEAPGGDPFAPVPDDTLCTYMYGGTAVARVEGVWRGEPVNARFERSDGCEIARWDRLVPALPRIAGDRA